MLTAVVTLACVYQYVILKVLKETGAVEIVNVVSKINSINTFSYIAIGT